MSKKNKENLEQDYIAPVEEETSETGKKKKKRNSKKLRYGAASAVVLVLVTAIVVAFNVMAQLVAQRTPLKLDLTPDNRYELSEESIEAMKNLDKNIDITVTTTRDYFEALGNYYEQGYAQSYGLLLEWPYEMIPEILDKYSVYAKNGSGSVNVKYVDINKNPDIVANFKKNYTGEISDGNIVISCGDRVRVLGEQEVANLINVDSANSGQMPSGTKFVGEATLTTAILSVADAHPVKAGVIRTINGASIYEQGYEPVVSGVIEMLTKNGYDVEDIDLVTNIFDPGKQDLLILPVPSMDFTSDIIEKLGDFLYNSGKYGKDFIYIPSFGDTNLPNLAEFLADWSIEVSETYVMDEEKNSVQTPVYTLNSMTQAPRLTVADADTVGKLANEAIPIVAPFPKEVKILQKNNGVVATALLKSSSTSYPVIDGEEKTGDKGERNIVVMAKKETSDQFDVLASHVLVLGSPFMADSLVLTQNTTYNNASALIGIFNKMTGKENGVTIPEKALTQHTIAPTAGELKGIGIFVVYVIPALVAIAGIIVLLRRRNK